MRVTAIARNRAFDKEIPPVGPLQLRKTPGLRISSARTAPPRGPLPGQRLPHPSRRSQAVTPKSEVLPALAPDIHNAHHFHPAVHRAMPKCGVDTNDNTNRSGPSGRPVYAVGPELRGELRERADRSPFYPEAVAAASRLTGHSIFPSAPGRNSEASIPTRHTKKPESHLSDCKHETEYIPTRHRTRGLAQTDQVRFARRSFTLRPQLRPNGSLVTALLIGTTKQLEMRPNA